MPIVSLAEQKTFMGLTGTQDDQLLSNLILQAQAQVERDTGRVFAYASNTTSTYSTDGEAIVRVRDMPANGSNTRTVTLSGVALVNGTSYWLLPDRRNPEVSTVLQLRPFDRSRTDWWKAFPNWFDANMDNPRWAAQLGMPNDLVINGSEGHPNPVPADVVGMIKLKCQLLYWQNKAGASGTVTTPTGDLIDLSARDPVGYPEFVRDWRIRSAVAGV
jgi:hypothetical protein